MPDQKRTYILGGVFEPENKSEVEYTLSEMKSIKNVDVNLGTKEVSFQFDPDSIEESFIQSTLTSLGYSIRQD
jgi:cation transport ATPase